MKTRSKIGIAFIAVTFAALGLLASCVNAQLRGRFKPTGKEVSFQHDGQDRNYRVHVPKDYDAKKKTPLVVFLHGGGGNSAQGSGMGLSTVADQHGFIAVYPNAIDKHWNDGRDSPLYAAQDKNTDDAAFVIAVVDRVCNKYNIDPQRVFVAGVSNGGFMSQRLAMEHSRRFSAAGMVVSSMGKSLAKKFDPDLPVSVLFINGTEDPVVPYAGGPIKVDLFPQLGKRRKQPAGGRGYCMPTDDAVALWLKKNKLPPKPTLKQLPDTSADDGSKVELSLWKNGDQGTSVALYKVIGGGHSLPGTSQRLPERLVGRTNMDIDGFEVIWSFFDQHGRKQTRH